MHPPFTRTRRVPSRHLRRQRRTWDDSGRRPEEVRRHLRAGDRSVSYPDLNGKTTPPSPRRPGPAARSPRVPGPTGDTVHTDPGRGEIEVPDTSRTRGVRVPTQYRGIGLGRVHSSPFFRVRGPFPGPGPTGTSGTPHRLHGTFLSRRVRDRELPSGGVRPRRSPLPGCVAFTGDWNRRALEWEKSTRLPST